MAPVYQPPTPLERAEAIVAQHREMFPQAAISDLLVDWITASIYDYAGGEEQRKRQRMLRESQRCHGSGFRTCPVCVLSVACNGCEDCKEAHRG